MLKREDIVEGAFIWWTAERYINTWSCPCKIVEVEEEGDKIRFRVLSLDDFKTSSYIHYDGEASNNEMRPVDALEVRKYIFKQISELKKEILDSEAKIEQLNMDIDQYKQFDLG